MGLRRHERQGDSDGQTITVVRNAKGRDRGGGGTRTAENGLAGMESGEQTGEEGSSSSSEDEARSSYRLGQAKRDTESRDDTAG